MRRNPYAPTFDSTPESTATTGGGVLRYASGIQPWNGNAGIFTRNANANGTKIQCWVPSRQRTFASA